MRRNLFIVQGVMSAPSEPFVSDNFGLNFTDCGSDYFRPGAEWPLQDMYPTGHTVRLCQNRNFLDHYHATLYDVKKRIPVYSSALGLCLDDDTDIAAIGQRSFYSNIDSVSSKNHEYCSTFQALDDYYLNNTSLYKFDRGHLLPNHITNYDHDWQRTTMTLTNAAAQHSTFNQQAWRQLECLVYKFLENEVPGQYANVITGVWGTKMIMNEDSDTKKEVHVPQYYWKAFCYDNDGVTYSWAYIQINENDQRYSNPQYMMSVKAFTNLYFEGRRIFDDKCQNAGLGPWNLIKQDWSGYRSRYGC